MRRISSPWLPLVFLVSMTAVDAQTASPGPSPASSASPAAITDALPVLVADPMIARLLAGVSARNLRDIDRHLVAFGTRNLYSETLHSQTRGVYAARDWIAGRFADDQKIAGNRMTVDLDTFTQPKADAMPRAVDVSNVYATLRGDDPDRATYVISSHYDSRNSDGNDPLADAPGADDNGSATSAVIEAARVMASAHFAGTIVFACFDGEEQGLYGSAHFAHLLISRGIHVDADLNNDIIGASIGHGGEIAPYDVRLFSEALPAGADLRGVDLRGTENDSPARELARFVRATDALYEPQMHVNMVYRSDRFLRGGDQQSFAAEKIAAVRFVEQNENFDHQHQNVRVENGIAYGDTLDHVDFDYLARVTQLNIAALATLALAPAAPIVQMDARHLGYDTTLSWAPVKGAVAYEVLWRPTDTGAWTDARSVTQTTATIALSKDNWLFAVRSVDAAGHRSVASFPTPVTR